MNSMTKPGLELDPGFDLNFRADLHDVVKMRWKRRGQDGKKARSSLFRDLHHIPTIDFFEWDDEERDLYFLNRAQMPTVANMSRELAGSSLKVDKLKLTLEKMKVDTVKHNEKLEAFRREYFARETSLHRNNLLGRVRSTLEQVEGEVNGLRETHGEMDYLRQEKFKLKRGVEELERERLSGQEELRRLYSVLAERKAVLSRMEIQEREQQKFIKIGCEGDK